MLLRLALLQVLISTTIVVLRIQRRTALRHPLLTYTRRRRPQDMEEARDLTTTLHLTALDTKLKPEDIQAQAKDLILLLL